MRNRQWRDACDELPGRIEAAIAKRRAKGLPHAGDDIPDAVKLAAALGELSEVARAMSVETRERVRDEWFDVAVVALLAAATVELEAERREAA